MLNSFNSTLDDRLVKHADTSARVLYGLLAFLAAVLAVAWWVNLSSPLATVDVSQERPLKAISHIRSNSHPGHSIAG